MSAEVLRSSLTMFVSSILHLAISSPCCACACCRAMSCWRTALASFIASSASIALERSSAALRCASLSDFLTCLNSSSISRRASTSPRNRSSSEDFSIFNVSTFDLMLAFSPSSACAACLSDVISFSNRSLSCFNVRASARASASSEPSLVSFGSSASLLARVAINSALSLVLSSSDAFARSVIFVIFCSASRTDSESLVTFASSVSLDDVIARNSRSADSTRAVLALSFSSVAASCGFKTSISDASVAACSCATLRSLRARCKSAVA
mmetsp:Transcript_4678/g.15624  ORF Transcript_4678/g.15624 Transcript_4678/m.15624 type:complete len:268 (-) Transcript_4678:1187-1990(-)